MKQQEKQILLHYLRNIFQEKPDPDSPSNLIRLVMMHDKDLFGYSINEALGKRRHDFEEDDNLCAIGAALYGQLADQNKKTLPAPKYANILSRKFDLTVTCLCDTFDIAPEYRPLLQCMIYAAKLPRLRRIINCFCTCAPREVIDMNEIDFYAKMCGIKPRDIEAAVAVNGPLIESGVLRITYGDRAFSANFEKLMGMEFKSVEQVIHQMIGEPLKTDLTMDNFAYMSRDLNAAIAITRHAIKTKQRGVNILLYGAPGVGKTELAKIIAAESDANLYVSPNPKADKEERLPSLAQLHCALKKEDHAIILFDEAEDVFSVPIFVRNAPSKLYLNKCLENNPKPVIWITNNIADMDPAYVRRFSLAINVKAPDSVAKIAAWRKVFEKHDVVIDDAKLEKLSRKYDIAMSVLDTAVRNMKNTGDENMLEYTITNLNRAITGRLPRPVADGVVPFSTRLLNTDTDLEQLAARIRDKNMRRFSLCLYGAPGTGKTAYADYLGEMLGMPVLKKRASDLMGMYVGQTEKNIARAFAEARDTGAILVFDEADSFLRDRGR
ncbi:AAA family ATPase, partial [bacterium]|nr:AAA family ATPase [bacterium]